MAAEATVVFVGEMGRVVRHRAELLVISLLLGTFEGYVASLLGNGAGLGILVAMTVEDGLPASPGAVALTQI
ncbi:hypothetical protein [Streptomyces sp. NPDC056921]|uniref:hypothetical protein n=1 Tax=Streptomyces sp. NPDC056921 TaxID=3345966 RepID=UPI00363E35C4